ncbi:cadherin domain-containing protein [Candidatus Poriferisodalis sp.]|uniref:cadherin domain-containing protein n=1 Tax=Candidatus Poriferisodalis sp. TaxID=3101277 RepID=UPI003B52E090
MLSAVARLRRPLLVVFLLMGTLVLPVLSSTDARAQTPAAPVISAVASGDQALTVAWNHPVGVTVADIVAYDMRYIESSASAADKADDTKWTQISDAWSEGSLRVIVSPLTNGTSYDVQARAVTSSDGNWSATSTGTPREPGSTRSTATAMVNELPVRGVLDSDSDIDYFRFTVSGTREFFTLTAGSTDTYGKLYRSSGSLIGSNDDANLSSGPQNFKLDGRLTSGTYYIEVTGYGGATGPYTLHLETSADSTSLTSATPIGLDSVTRAVFHDTGATSLFQAGDVDYFKLELAADTTISVRASGFVADTYGTILDADGESVAINDDSYLEPTRFQFALRATLAAGTYYIRAEPFFGDDSGLYYLFVYESPEPGSSRATAHEIDISQTAGGDISPAGDTDYFKFTLDESTRVALVGSSRDLDIEVTLQNSVGTALNVNSYNISIGSIDTFVIYDTLTAGTYYLGVQADQASDTGTYLVLLRPDSTYERLAEACPAARTSTPIGVNDPLFGCQWHLDNDGQFGGTAGEDINLGNVWNTYNGTNVNVVVVDQGLDYLHEDLEQNVDESKNHSYRRVDDVFGERSSHGTAVAGLIAARDNSLGMRGVAPRATIYAYDLLSAYSTFNTADAASRGRVTTSVSNNSWGPSEGPGASRASRLWERAIDSGVTEGNSGSGVVYVWSAGNGDDDGDWASLDEVANYYGVTAVCAVDNDGKRSNYSEQGPNLWVCAPSDSTDKVYPDIATTWRYSRYTDRFGGTSSAAPMVSGVAALVRDVDSTLSWRDVKLILAASARTNDDTDTGWETGASKYGTTGTYSFNHQYGFGVVDASAAVGLAGSWAKAPAMRTAIASYDTARSIPDTGGAVSSTVSLEGEVDFTEFVEVNVDFDAPRFRNLEIELESPQGATSVLTVPNSADCASGYPCPLTGVFRFGSARHLGEDPRGTWTLRVTDKVRGGSRNTVNSWNLKVYGHRQSPDAVSLSYVQPGSGELTVAWDEPDITGVSAITGYEVRHIRSDAADKSDDKWDETSSTCTSATCIATISGLTDSVSYDVQVRAVTAVADRKGGWSAKARGTPGATDSEPFFVDGERTTRSIGEHTGSGADVGSAVTAQDFESVTSSETLTYSLGGSDAALFGIDSSGQITTTFDPDYEVRSSYTVTVSVTDSKADDGTADTAVDDTITVDIEVVDAAEPPSVVECTDTGDCTEITSPHEIDFPEGSFEAVFDYDFDDPDTELVRIVLDGADADQFYISGTGVLGFLHDFGHVRPDFEDPLDVGGDNVYDLTLQVSDGTTTVELKIEVTVTDQNEKPTLTGDGMAAVDENSTSTGLFFSADDPENDSITWTLSGEDRLDFEIAGGSLTFKDQPDFEMPADHDRDNKYQVDVEASDGDNADAISVEVEVEDVNESSDISGPQTRNYPENSTGTVAEYRANDPEERERVTWSLAGSDAGFFEIDRNGVLRFMDPPDHEATRGTSYQVTVQASDRKDANGDAVLVGDSDIDDTHDVTVTVTDVDEAPTITSGPTGASLGEKHTGEVARFEASDPEGEDIIWTLLGTDRDDLAIGHDDGIVEFAAAPDFEAPVDSGRNNSYIVTVEASDGNKKATQRLTVTVTNVDESGAASLSSSQPQDGAQLTATLSDPDGGIASTTWSWERSSDQSNWTSVSGATNGTTTSSYTPSTSDIGDYLRATATYTDRESRGLGPSEDRTAQAESANPVRLNDRDNHAPTFPASETGERNIAEDSAEGTLIGDPVEADDDDVDDQGDLTYSLGGTDRSSLSINARTGQLRTKAPLDHERKSSYRVLVTARDPSGSTATQLVTITVDDVDEPPVVSGPATPAYAENRLDAVGRYTADDPEGEDVTWSLSGPDSNDFDIDEDSGVLSFVNQPDYDIASDNVYDITIRADDGTQPQHGTLDVTVQVTDVNEPPAVSGQTDISWPENREATIDLYSASDPEGVTATWSLAGADRGDFEIDDSGELKFAQPPDYEQPADSNRRNDYEITVRAFDGTHYGTLPVTVTVENEDELGMLELSATLPGVGSTLRAALTEPDVPVTDHEWMWWRSDDRNDPSSWELIHSAMSSSYRPVADDLGNWLRVRVKYIDAFDSQILFAESVNSVQVKAGPTRPVGPIGPTGPTGPSGPGGGGGGGGGGDFDVGVATFVVANGWSAADVGVASVLAARSSGAVVVYTAGDELSEETRELLREALPAEVIIVGGNAAVSRDVRTQIRAASSESGISRVSGADRADTAAGTARRILGGPSGAGRVTVIVANGWSPPDIGAAAALAARSGRSAVLYTQRDRLPDASAAVLGDYGVARVILIGGTAAISVEVHDAIVTAAGDASVSRLTGADRIDTAAQTARRVLGNPAAAPDGVTLVIANGWSAPDVGVAAALAAATENAAVAYTNQGTLPEATAALIRDYRPTQVIIVGGRAAVANDVRSAITETVSSSTDVRRITGSTRTDTAARAARRILANL